jgi:hypothetical protein
MFCEINFQCGNISVYKIYFLRYNGYVEWWFTFGAYPSDS